MTTVLVYNRTTERIERYYLENGDAMPYVPERRLTVAEFRGSSKANVVWTDKRFMEEILQEAECLSLRDLAVGGRELMELGFAPGPELGTTLNTLLEEVMDEKLPNERDSLLQRALEIKGGH